MTRTLRWYCNTKACINELVKATRVMVGKYINLG